MNNYTNYFLDTGIFWVLSTSILFIRTIYTCYCRYTVSLLGIYRTTLSNNVRAVVSLIDRSISSVRGQVWDLDKGGAGGSARLLLCISRVGEVYTSTKCYYYHIPSDCEFDRLDGENSTLKAA